MRTDCHFRNIDIAAPHHGTEGVRNFRELQEIKLDAIGTHTPVLQGCDVRPVCERDLEV